MGFKNQLKTLKDNWLMVVLVIIVLVVVSGGSDLISTGSGNLMMESSMAKADYAARSPGIPSGGSGFAPDVQERKITRSASLSVEVENGNFENSNNAVKGIVGEYDGFILNSNIRERGSKRSEYMNGYYNIKVQTDKYEPMLEDLKGLGEVTHVSESASDVTGRYTDLETELASEKQRLERYEEILAESNDVEDKLDVTDRIYDLERRIKYLNESVNNVDERVEYTTISFSLQEEKASYADVAMTKFSKLVERFVASFNVFINFFFIIIPWAVIALIVYGLVRVFRRKE